VAAGPHASVLSALIRPAERATAQDWAKVLAALPLFARVGKRHLRQLGSLAEVREFERGEPVVTAGTAADGFYLILSGEAKVAGRPRARLLGQGDYFGEMALFDDEPRSATVVATNQLQTMRIPRPAFLRLLRKEPSIAVALLAQLAQRVRALEARPGD
jgi:CRP-like cAMP-binding protein